MREHVQALVKNLKGSRSEDDEELVDEADEWLTKLEQWEALKKEKN
jgi:hypothetical protein